MLVDDAQRGRYQAERLRFVAVLGTAAARRAVVGGVEVAHHQTFGAHRIVRFVQHRLDLCVAEVGEQLLGHHEVMVLAIRCGGHVARPGGEAAACVKPGAFGQSSQRITVAIDRRDLGFACLVEQEVARRAVAGAQIERAVQRPLRREAARHHLCQRGAVLGGEVPRVVANPAP